MRREAGTAPPPFTGPHPDWRPLLFGERAERARAAVLAIAEALREPPAPGTEGAAPGLSRGHCGRAVLFTYLAHALDEPRWRGAAAEALEAAVDSLAEQPVGPELLGGFAGVGWTVEHLAGRLYPAEEAPAGDEIDAALAALLKGGWAGPYDLVGGLAGFVVYALEAAPRPAAVRCLERAVGELRRHSEEVDGGRAWFTPPELVPGHQVGEAPHGYFNLGLAHGVPGVVVALARARAEAPGVAGGVPELEPAVDRLLAWEQPPDAPARFPNWVPAAAGGTPQPAGEPERTRLAWCYGDLGVASALAVAARATDAERWGRAALRVARHAAARPLGRTGVQDAPLCHGAAGVAHQLNRLAQASGDSALADAALRFYDRTLELRRPGEGVGGYLAWEPARGGWRSSPALLTGAAGVGLALLAGLSPLQPEWDRALGLCGRRPAGAVSSGAPVPKAKGCGGE